MNKYEIFKLKKWIWINSQTKVCEIIADFEEKGMLQSDLWKKTKTQQQRWFKTCT